MGRQVSDFRKAGKSIKTGHGNRKYPWTRWTNGNAWEVKEGEDFTCTPDSFIAILRAKGAATGLRLRTRRGQNNRKKTVVVFQFYKDERNPPVAPKKRVVKKSSSEEKKPKRRVVIRRSKKSEDQEAAGSVLTVVPPDVEESGPECPEECAEGHTYDGGCLAQILPQPRSEQENEVSSDDPWDDELPSAEDDVDSEVEAEEDDDEEAMEMDVEGETSPDAGDDGDFIDIGAKEELPSEQRRAEISEPVKESGPCDTCGLSNGRHTANCSAA